MYGLTIGKNELNKIIRGEKGLNNSELKPAKTKSTIALIEKGSFIVRGFYDPQGKMIPCHIIIQCFIDNDGAGLADLDKVVIKQGNNEFCNSKSLEFIYQLEKQRLNGEKTSVIKL